MISVLTNLHEAVATYGIVHQNNEEEDQAQNALLIALSEIEINLNQLYISHGSHKMARKSFRNFYSQLRPVFNKTYHQKKQKINTVILKFHEIFKNLEDIYHEDMNLNEPLTDYQYHLLKVRIMGKFPALKEGLLEKGIWQNLLSEIQSAIDGHFNSDNTKLRYHHLLFYNRLFQELNIIARDKRKKDWERRFIETMININFNHMGFFNRLCDIINYQLGTLSETDQLKSIAINGLRINQAAQYNYIYFEPARERLADLLNTYTKQQKELNAIPEIEKEVEVEVESDAESDGLMDEIENSGILSTLSRSEIIVLFHYLFKAGFLKGKNKLEAAKSFSTFVFTSNDIKIPITQLVKIDRNKYQASIKTVKKKLLLAIAFMDEDLKELGRLNQLDL